MSLSQHKKKIALIVGLFLLGVAIFIFVLNKSDIREIGKQLESISLWKVAVLIISSLIIFFIYAFSLKMIISRFGARIPIGQSAVLKYIGDAVSYITPVVYIGGEFIMAYILKKNHKLPVSSGMGAIVMDKIISLTVAIFYFAAGAITFILYFAGNFKVLLPTVIVLTGSIGFLIYFYHKTWRKKDFLSSILRFLRLHKIKSISEGKVDIDKFDANLHHFIKYNSRYFYLSIGLVLFGTFLTLLQYKLILTFLGHNLSLSQILMLRIIFMAANAVPIPGAFGTQEAAQAAYFNLLGLGPSAGVAFIIVIRFLQLINVGLGLIFLSFFGLKLFKPPEITNGENNQ